MTTKRTSAQQAALDRIRRDRHIQGPVADLPLTTLRALAARGDITLTEPADGRWTATRIPSQRDIDAAACDCLLQQAILDLPCRGPLASLYSIPDDMRACCENICGSPFERPHSFYRHFRTTKHVAMRHHVDVHAVRRALPELESVPEFLRNTIAGMVGDDRDVAIGLAAEWKLSAPDFAAALKALSSSTHQ